MKFEGFNLKKDLVVALNKLGYIEANEVQFNVIPKALKGENLIVKSSTGSGKTHSFLIPILNGLDFNLGTQALIISPTKELALQTYSFLKEFKEFYPNLSTKLITSGIDFTRNLEDLNKSSQIIISTPGRLSSILKDHSFDFSNIKTVVLDEVDMLAEQGFFNDVERIVDNIDNPQILVFSATISQQTRDFLRKNIKETTIIDLNKGLNDNITHYFVNTKHMDVFESIDVFLENVNPFLLFIFANKKTLVAEIYSHLRSKKVNCGIISGDLSQRERRSMLRRANNNEFQVLVCSDVGARGIDVEDVSDVLSVDIPNNLEYYFHRAGRTARNGKTGNSYVFYNNETVEKARELINMGVKPIYWKITRNLLEIDQKPVFVKNRHRKDEDLANKVKSYKVKTKDTKVKPNYKKKRKRDIEKIVHDHKREKIKKQIRSTLDKKFKEEAKRKK